MEQDRDCPDCDGQEFYRAASTLMHLGEKVKWRCTECGHGFVTINDAVDTGTA